MVTDQMAQEPPLPPRAEPGQPNVEAVRPRLTDMERQARTLIRQRPVVAVLTAVGVGYLAARLLARATR